MKYKVLITGKNDLVIDGFFAQMSDHFEVLSTSIRFEDMTGHMNYFAPDVFVCCLNKETQDHINKTAGIKRRLSQMNVPFVVIGSREDCARFEAGAPRVSDLTLCLPMDADAIRGEILKLMQKFKASGSTETKTTQPTASKETVNAGAVKPAVPGGTANAGAAKPAAPAGTVNAGAAKPAAPAGTANASAAKPAGSTGSAGTGDSDVFRKEKKRDLSTGLIKEALTSEEAYVEMIDALDRHLTMLETGITRRKHVLIVDDDSMMLKLMKEYLHEKYDVATALNGKIALKFLERKQTDLILLDYEMPGENGPAVLEQLRASVDTRDIPVIFLTGVTEGRKIQEALALKPQSYLLKPIQRGKLMEAIGKVIG